MLFETTPKTKREDLFGRDFLVDKLVSLLRDKDVRMIVLKGLRRTGKTSILNVALAETKLLVVKIDVREAPYYDRKEFMAYLVEHIKTTIGESLFQKVMKHISKIQAAYKDLSTTFFLDIEKKLFTFFGELNAELQEKKQYLILAFDEVQLLQDHHWNAVFAAMYDNYPHLKLILTGSEIGLLDTFLGKKDADSPLFGRALLDIEVTKFNEEETSSFLLKGFAQSKKPISPGEISEVIGNFNGIIGWATQYGWLRSKGHSHQQAIAMVMEDGSKLTRKELEAFLARRNKARYLKVLRWLSRGHNQWNLLKNQFLKEGTRISDRQLHLYLSELMEYGFITKIQQNYAIADPLLLKGMYQ